MSGDLVVSLILRWLHILSATLALGVPLYVRLVLMPAASALDEENRSRLNDAIARRWRIVVHILIVVFLATGFYNFLGIARWRSFEADDKRLYHMLFGIKLVLALAMFTISSALAGRAAMFAFIRAKAATWLLILILLGVVLLAISGGMRFLGPAAGA